MYTFPAIQPFGAANMTVADDHQLLPRASKDRRQFATVRF